MRFSRATLCFASLVVAAACGADSTGPSAAQPDYTTPGSIVIADFSDNQSAPAGTAFPRSLDVIVFTPDNHKCYGCTVIWTLTPGQFQGGPVQTTTVVTGMSSLSITSLAPRGQYHVTATIGNGQSVTFSLTAI